MGRNLQRKLKFMRHAQSGKPPKNPGKPVRTKHYAKGGIRGAFGSRTHWARLADWAYHCEQANEQARAKRLAAQEAFEL